MTSPSPTSDNVIYLGALRSRLVAKLTGYSKRQLQYWHGTELLEAHERPGARGYPRLYSWVDYMKLREAAKLSRARIPTKQIRKAVAFLDQVRNDWYLLPLDASGKDVMAEIAWDAMMAATRAGQFVLPVETLVESLEAIRKEGPLGELSSFGDAVEMDPTVLAGNPVVRGTRIETGFIAALSAYEDPQHIASTYRIPLGRVERAIAFEDEVAA